MNMDRASFELPFRGAGFVWILLILLVAGPAIVLGDDLGIPGKIAFLGILGSFFAASFAGAVSEPPAPPVFPRIDLYDLLLMSIVCVALAVIAAGLPYWFLVRHAESERSVERAAIEREMNELHRATVGGDDETGEAHQRLESRRADLERLNELRPFDVLARSKPRVSIHLALALLFALLGVIYIPAALARAALGRPRDAFELGSVIRLITGGGAEYLTIALAGLAMSIGPPLVAILMFGLSPRTFDLVLVGGPGPAMHLLQSQAGIRDGLTLVVLWAAGTAYAAGVSGWAMGRLVITRSLGPTDTG
jgi:hypothetical protein